MITHTTGYNMTDNVVTFRDRGRACMLNTNPQCYYATNMEDKPYFPVSLSYLLFDFGDD